MPFACTLVSGPFEAFPHRQLSPPSVKYGLTVLALVRS